MKKKVLKPFDAAKARAGAELCTRDGRKARVVCWDVKRMLPILALVTLADGTETNYSYTNEGRFLVNGTSDCDLMLVEYEEEKVECKFKPFDKVIFRRGKSYRWTAGYFSHTYKDPVDDSILYDCGGAIAAQCLPYEGNEHLIGTKSNPKP